MAKTIEVTSPFDGETVGTVDATQAEAVSDEIAIAARAFKQPYPTHERVAVLERAVNLLRERKDQFAQTIMREAGKPISLASGEVDRAIDTLTLSAAEARTLTGDVLPMDATESGAGMIGYTRREPVGVIAAITPFNFPLNLCCHKIGPAIAAGCTIIHKPASATPLSAQLLHQLLLDSGLSEDRYRLVFGGGRDIGGAMVSDDRIAHITFTGSSEVGWQIRKDAPRASVGLELGNSTPLIVAQDADLAAASQAIAQHGYSYAGQSCISIQRVLVHSDVHDELAELLTRDVAAVHAGDPANDDVSCGPLIDSENRDRVLKVFSSAVDRGAKILVGGDYDRNVVQPTVIDNVEPTSPVTCDELFGPAVMISTYRDDDDAITIANATDYGLQAGVYTRDISRAMRMSEQLDFGGVVINNAPTFRADQQPYGGFKGSGNTKEGPHWAIREMTREKLVLIKP